jgi:CBS domain-containing protein
MKIRDFMKIKGRAVITIRSDETVHTAVQKLVENNIGALPVCDARGTLVGIISERDLLKVFSRPGDTKAPRVKDVMTRDVAVGIVDDDLDYVMNTMKQKGIRHLPVMDGGKLVGIVSVRDIVEERLEACQVEVRHLSDYISGGYV